MDIVERVQQQALKMIRGLESLRKADRISTVLYGEEKAHRGSQSVHYLKGGCKVNGTRLLSLVSSDTN